MAEYEQRDTNLIKHHEEDVKEMATVHDELVKATNKLIKQTHVQHEKKIQHFEMEIHSNDRMNLILRQVLIKVIQSFEHIIDIWNYNFNEVFQIFEVTLHTLKSLCPQR